MNIDLGPELFRFDTFKCWVDHARSRFAEAHVDARTAVLVDCHGRICSCGGDMMKARDDEAFPVYAYLYREDALAALETYRKFLAENPPAGGTDGSQQP